MKLDKKKELAARTLRVSKDRIWFNPTRLTEIKESITKQDIRDLLKDKAIKIKPITGKRKKEKRRRRREGKIKKKPRKRKRGYIIRIRKLRKYLSLLRNNNEISREDYYKLRSHAKSGIFASLKHLKDYVASMKKLGKLKEVAKSEKPAKEKLAKPEKKAKSSKAKTKKSETKRKK